MRREGMTIREAAEEWVREFNAIDQGMIAKLMEHDPDEWSEVTKPSACDRVYVYEVPGKEHYGEIEKVEDEKYLVELDDGSEVSVSDGDFEVDYDGVLPMWGTMWQFGDSCDDWWLEEGNGIETMSSCGFRIFSSDEFGYFFGIDGAGYDFYEAHWVPLYKKRGLKWHDPAAEVAEYMIDHGRRATMSGNYHFEFDEIAKQFEVEVTDEFKERVKKHLFDSYSYMIADLDTTEDFDFMFYTGFCPNYTEEE